MEKFNMKNKKNVAIIISTLNKGGAERVAANMSIAFAKYFNVILIVHDARDITYEYGGELIDLKLPPAATLCGKVITLIKRVKKVSKIKKDYNIECCISHLPMCNYVNILSRRKEKVITYVHSMESNTKSNVIRERFTALLSDYMVCVSECVRQNMITNFHVPSKKLKTIYNFCDFNSNIISGTKLDDKIEISNMGRLVKEKGQWHLIRAMKKVVEKYKKVHLSIYGEGELRDILSSMIGKLKLDEYITLMGYVDNPFSKIAASDIYVNPAESEGLPMALIEAGNCQLPIISTDCDAGCREILAPDTPVDGKTNKIEFAEYGILVPVNGEFDYERLELSSKEKSLADAIIVLIGDNDLRKKYAEKAMERAQQFRSEVIMDKWFELIG